MRKRIYRSYLHSLILVVPVAVTSGLLSALFLASLEFVTNIRLGHSEFIYALPAIGFFVGWLYYRFGRAVEAGNNLLIDEIHEPRRQIPARLVPLVFIGTILTHLGGGSAGREGTAVQMGGAIGDFVNRAAKMTSERRHLLLMAGLAAGFASVFGTPWAGAVFGVEVLTFGRLRMGTLLPCLLAAFIAHLSCLFVGIHHADYGHLMIAHLSLNHVGYAAVAGAVFGLSAFAFARSVKAVAAVLSRFIRYPPLRPALGGAVVAILILTLNLQRYSGLGVPVIVESLRHAVPAVDFIWKFLLTVLTLGAGFKGGEVTPLFFIGATLGNALSALLPLAPPLMAALGFVAVFGGAANVPIAATLMGVELFGVEPALYFAVACMTSYAFSGKTGIYHAQRREFLRFKLY